MGRHPFEETDEGHYRVITPVGGLEPESVSVTVEQTTYRLSGHVSTDSSSKLRPDVLVYEELVVE